jgi:hypothetical protein
LRHGCGSARENDPGRKSGVIQLSIFWDTTATPANTRKRIRE